MIKIMKNTVSGMPMLKIGKRVTICVSTRWERPCAIKTDNISLYAFAFIHFYYRKKLNQYNETMINYLKGN